MTNRITVTIREACELSGLGRSTIYKLFKDPSAGITPRKCGKRTLILVKELEDYLSNLPSEAA